MVRFLKAGAAGLVNLSGTKFREIRNRAFEASADVGCADDEKRQLFIAFVYALEGAIGFETGNHVF